MPMLQVRSKARILDIYEGNVIDDVQGWKLIETCTMHTFLQENNSFDSTEIKTVLRLKVDERIVYGGGAAALSMIKCRV
jgi:hypothetical protein